MTEQEVIRAVEERMKLEWCPCYMCGGTGKIIQCAAIYRGLPCEKCRGEGGFLLPKKISIPDDYIQCLKGTNKE